MANQKESNVNICPDNHHCENGSICVENSQAEGKYYCDCDESMIEGATVFSGLYCQHEATVYCSLTGSVSKTSFCTNMGTCSGNVDDHEEHLGCDCPKGYSGGHCQFIEGSEIPDVFVDHSFTSVQTDVASQRGGDGTGLGAVGVVSIIVVALLVLGVALVYIFKGKRAQNTAPHVIDSSKSSDGELHDADGSNLPATVPTQTFESDGGRNDSDIHAVDSGHLA